MLIMSMAQSIRAMSGWWLALACCSTLPTSWCPVRRMRPDTSWLPSIVPVTEAGRVRLVIAVAQSRIWSSWM
jgi:hypothetical protein